MSQPGSNTGKQLSLAFAPAEENRSKMAKKKPQRSAKGKAAPPATPKLAAVQPPPPAPLVDIIEAEEPSEAKPSKNAPRATAESMAKLQKEISVSEFFAKNRHLLGFDNKRKALLMTVKEAVDNSLDACEEAGHPPRDRSLA